MFKQWVVCRKARISFFQKCHIVAIFGHFGPPGSHTKRQSTYLKQLPKDALLLGDLRELLFDFIAVLEQILEKKRYKTI